MPFVSADPLVVRVVNPSRRGRRIDPNRPPIFFRGKQVNSLEALRKELRRLSDPMGDPLEIDHEGNPAEPLGHLSDGTPIYSSRRVLRIICDPGQIYGWVQALQQVCTFVPGRPRAQELNESPLIKYMEITVLEDDGEKAPAEGR